MTLHTQLRSLTVSDCYEITDHSISTIAQHCSDLTLLSVSNCYRITDASLQDIVQKCRALQSLDVAACFNVTDITILCIAEQCQLQQQCTDVNMSDQSASNSLAADISIKSHTDGTSNSSIYSTSTHNPDNTTLTHTPATRSTHSIRSKLTYLNLSHCDLITPAAMLQLAAHCATLQSLTVKACADLSPALQRTLHCSPHLHTLNMAQCSDVTDSVFCESFAVTDCSETDTLSYIYDTTQLWPCLTSLSLSHCSQLTNKSITTIADKCANLTSLDLTGCKLLTDSCILYLCRKCKYLCTLHLDSCVLITAKCVYKLKKYCPMLSTFTFADCPLVVEK